MKKQGKKKSREIPQSHGFYTERKLLDKKQTLAATHDNQQHKFKTNIYTMSNILTNCAKKITEERCRLYQSSIYPYYLYSHLNIPEE